MDNNQTIQAILSIFVLGLVGIGLWYRFLTFSEACLSIIAVCELLRFVKFEKVKVKQNA